MKIMLKPGELSGNFFDIISMVFLIYRVIVLTFFLVVSIMLMGMFGYALYKEAEFTTVEELHYCRTAAFWFVPILWVVLLVMSLIKVVSGFSARSFLVETKGYKSL